MHIFLPSHMKSYQWHFDSCISSPQNNLLRVNLFDSISWITSVSALLLGILHNTFLLACFSDTCFSSQHLLIKLVFCFLQYFNTCTTGRADGNCQLRMMLSSFCASGDSKRFQIHMLFVLPRHFLCLGDVVED